jgi:hypothetical protein
MSDDDDSTSRSAADLAQRAVDAVLRMVRRANALAGGILVVAVFVCVGSFALGLAALSDGIRSVWIVLGGFFVVVGVGSVVLAIVRLWGIRRTSRQLVEEVTALIRGDRGNERIVIETIEASDAASQESALVASRGFFTMQQSVVTAGRFVALNAALRAITTFPALILLSALVMLVFAGLGLIFLLALAL